MKSHFYIDCAADELIHSSLEEEFFLHRAHRNKDDRFKQRAPFEIVHKVGPADPALPYPFLLTVVTQGRNVLEADADVGWLHQGIEKALEQIPFHKATERVLRRLHSSAAPFLTLGFRIAVEKLYERSTHVSLRQRLLRTALLEGARVRHHWGVVERVAQLILAEGLLEKVHRAKTQSTELLSQLIELEAGNGRYTLEAHEALLAAIDAARERSLPAIEMLGESRALKARLEGRSVLERASALSLGLSGFYLRSLGLPDDLRLNHPELPYSMLDFQCQTAKFSDAHTRFLLRLSEIEQALLLIGHALRLASDASIASMEDANAFADNFDFGQAALPMATAFLEAPEGEMALSVASGGDARPSRVRIKTPSFTLMGALDAFLKGCDLDDVILILHTLGINMLEVDR